MGGNIIYINYELSSWQHMDDDVADTPAPVENRSKTIVSSGDSYRVTKYGGYVERYAGHNSTTLTGHRVVKYGGYVVQLGAGSAYGGQWKPSKPEDERYLGKPGEIIRTHPGRYEIETKIGTDGKAVMERHHTSAPNPKYHSNPHDHQITWSPSGHPIPGPPINYWDGNVPELKSYAGGIMKMERVICSNTPEQNAFTSISDFQDCMRHGGEVEFAYNGKEYGLFSNVLSYSESNYKMCISEIGNDDSEAWYDNSDDLLDYMIEDKKLRDIITEVEVFDRTI